MDKLMVVWAVFDSGGDSAAGGGSTRSRPLVSASGRVGSLEQTPSRFSAELNPHRHGGGAALHRLECWRFVPTVVA
jgi:hypothetical protein